MSFPLGRAMICAELDCNVVFDAARFRACPGCSSAEIYPVEAFLRRRAGERFAHESEAELWRLRALRSA